MKNLEQNFEKYADGQLNHHESPVDTSRLWEKIDAELRPKNHRLPPIWVWFLGIGLAAVLAGGVFYFNKNYKIESKATADGGRGTADGAADLSTFEKLTNLENAAAENQAAKNLSTFQKLTNLENAAAEKSSGEGLAGENFSKLTTLENAAAEKSSAENRGAENLSTFQKLTNLEALPAPLVFLKNPPPVAPQKVPDPSSNCYSFGRNSFSLKPYFGIYGGAAFPLKSLKARTAEFEALADRRRATETVLEAVQVGGFVGMRHPSGIFGEAGAEFDRINERFDWASTIKDTFGQVATSIIIVNGPGDTTFVKDTVQLVRETKTIKKTFNNYRTLSLPIAIGFELNRGKRFSPYLKLGVAINLRFGQKAEIALAPGGTTGRSQLFTSENAGSGHPFRTKIGIAPFVNLGARFHLKNGLSAFGEARYLHHSTEITSENYPVKQKYGLPGANLGLIFQF